MGDVNGTFVTKIDGIEYYADGVKNTGGSFSVNIAYIYFMSISPKNMIISQPPGLNHWGKHAKPVANIDNQGNLCIGINKGRSIRYF